MGIAFGRSAQKLVLLQSHRSEKCVCGFSLRSIHLKLFSVVSVSDTSSNVELIIHMFATAKVFSRQGSSWLLNACTPEEGYYVDTVHGAYRREAINI